jgi:branched-chain amino acid transport system ATP-binding protein
MSSALLEVDRLCAGYGRAQILFDVGLQVGAGEAVALLGRNGAGKSTTLKTIMGLIEPTSGTVRFSGHDITGWPSHRIARLGLGWVPEDRRIFTDLTVLQNLEVGRQAARGQSAPWTVQRLFELFPNLAAMPDRPGASMSGGEQQMLTVARTLMGNPQLVLFDEPSEGVAPVIVEQMARSINEMKRQGLAVLVCEQNLEFVAAICDRACVLEKGQVRFDGSMADLQADAGIRRELLGI